MGVGSQGRGGGLALLWSDVVCVKLQSYDKLHIDVVIVDATTSVERWRLTGFYGKSRRELRYRSWDCLRTLNDRSSLPWLCVGNFNEVPHASEQIGGVGRSERQMEGFRDAVSVCGFQDLGFIGLPYTWDNRQEGANNIKVRLDRGLANDSFLNLYREVKVWHVQTATLDHCALAVECLERSHHQRRRKRNFRYKNMWQRDPSYMLTVRNIWRSQAGGGDLALLQTRLRGMQQAPSRWDSEVFGSVKKTLATLRRDLEDVRGHSVGTGPSLHERWLMSCISELLSREETMERQRSRLDWLRDGDRNTVMFQAKSQARAKRNKITSLKKADGGLATKPEDIEVVATEYYKQLYSVQEQLEPDLVVEHVPARVTEAMNDRLTRPYTTDEVERALRLMKPNKAPGPDGFTAGFYQLHWDLLGNDVIRAVLDFLNGGVLSDDINQTTIVLIPKTRNPQEMEYRLISLCNVLYKICSKVLALRLRECLDEIVAGE